MFASDELDRILAATQAERRPPSVSVAVFHRGEIVWSRALGLADVERREGATPEHAYRIGSITKTFTAVCVLQLRDRGQVDLDAPLRAYVDEAPEGPTVRQTLAHLSGIQREPPGEIWETLEPPSRDELLERLAEAEPRLCGARRDRRAPGRGPLSRVPAGSRARPTRVDPDDARRDGASAGDGRPRPLDGGLGSRLRAVPLGRTGARGTRRRHARVPRGSRGRARGAYRCCGADERVHRCQGPRSWRFS